MTIETALDILVMGASLIRTMALMVSAGSGDGEIMAVSQVRLYGIAIGSCIGILSIVYIFCVYTLMRFIIDILYINILLAHLHFWNGTKKTLWFIL